MKRYKSIHVGCGGISRSWLSVTSKHPHIELVGLIDLDIEAAKQKAKEYGLDPAIASTDLASRIESTGADLVFDTTVPPAHHSVVMTALERDCHVFGEKPLAETIPDALEMVQTAAKAGVTYGVMQNRRWLPNGIQRVRTALDQGVIGTPHTFHTDFFIGAHFGGFRDEMKHVLLLDMAIHSFDQIRCLTDAMPQKVWANDWNPPGSWYADGASAVAFFEHGDQVHSSYRGSWCSEGLNSSWECDWRIIGTKGTLLWDKDDSIQVQQVASDEGFIRACKSIDIPKNTSEVPERHKAGIENFIQSLLDGTVPATPASDNIYSLAMVHGAIASAESGTTISIPSLLTGDTP